MPKIDSKQVLANERTYLNWLHMSVVTGGVAAGLLAGATGFSSDGDVSPASASDEIAAKFGKVLMLVSIVFALYAIWLYQYRYRRIYNFQTDNLQSVAAPLMMGGVLCSAFVLIFLIDVFSGRTIHP